MKKIVILIALIYSGISVNAQTPYTQNQFAYDSLINVVYGTAIDYAGNTDTLKLDIYKPVGDSNCLRPVIVLVHGGAWIGGSKEDYDLVYLSRQLAKKGWVVANINYRLGTHKTSNYTMYALCNTSISQPCGYICDSAEVYRANFRAMQDAKGVIRFMKSRNAIDSTDINNVFIAGESAGGFVALAAAFTDKISEKHLSCYAVSDAPVPDPDLAAFGCIPTTNNLSRPDLGSIDGPLYLGTYNATVKGVGSLFGGVLDFNIFQQTSDTPVVYMFHQGSDVIVNYNYGTLLGRISWECYAQSNICQTYYFYPNAFGSEGIRQYFVAMGTSAPAYQADILSNYSYLNNCYSNGHALDNAQLRLQNMVALFAGKIALSGNNPQTNCLNLGIDYITAGSGFTLFPNPCNKKITASYMLFESQNTTVYIYSNSGIKIKTVDFGVNPKGENSHEIDLSNFKSGLYFLSIGLNGKNYSRSFLVQ